MTAVIDYGLGNIYSVVMAVRRCQEEVLTTSNPDDLKKVDRIILPGVGAFDEGMDNLNKLGLASAIKEEVSKKKPTLAICLGMQMIFEQSEEGNQAGLGIFKGKVVRFKRNNLPVPHMGWNQVFFQEKAADYLKSVGQNQFFYFAHSYYVLPQDHLIVAGVTEYGCRFVSFVCWENVIGVQFHPEKSGTSGLSFLSVFLRQMPNAP
ncbi:MAG: imidazole glycerol phosphate synthase subunit HisH [Candidatus Omnitrophica bacterium]|nr:imidazole glycerol phosphate synthase subunit HisH [Candidatus Omnitrophota bacterium]